MSYRSRRSITVFVLLALLAVSAGCLGLSGGSELPDHDTVTESLGSVEVVEGSVQLEQQVGNETTEMQLQFVQRMTTGEFRATIQQGSPDVRYEMVSDGSTTWVYNRTAGTVTTVELEGVRTEWNRSVESVANVFASLKASSGDEDVSISPLPAVPGGGGSATGAVGAGSLPSIGNLSLTYQGTATAAGENAHVVDFEPKTNESLITNGTIWFDDDRFFPVKAEYSASIDGRSSTVTTEYNNLTYNPSVEEGTFTFEPPANATIENDSQSLSVYQSREELVSATDRSVPDPELPDEYQFAKGTISHDGTNGSMTLRYSSDDRSFGVTKRTPPRLASDDADGGEDGEAIDVAGHEGTYREADGASIVSWECEDSEYTVAGQLSRDELGSVAESMACE